jgi:23S rRNA (cytosine1962-C5)-methyltransferase
LWVFSNEVAEHPAAAAGDLVEVLASGGASLGAALYHPHSLISARLLGAGQIVLDRQFFLDRIGAALALRRQLFPEETCYRLIHGESDGLPGLIVDRFDRRLVVQTLSNGMDRRLDLICNALEELVRPTAILERNDSPLRAHEELDQRVGVLRGGDAGPLEIEEAGFRYRLDLLQGQKTGFFLDQKLNRQAVARYCRNRRVLDCFCNVGGFALHAARAGASLVKGVDVSTSAIEQARENARLNEVTAVEFEVSDVFGFLQALLQRGERYGVVILDPPSFTRSRKNVSAAKRAYRRLNEAALRVLEPGGFLVTASCSHHLFEEVFYEAVFDAALRAGRVLRLLERRGQSPDHPVLPAMPETSYLKLGVFQAL